MHLVWKSEAVRKQANQPKQVYLQIYIYKNGIEKKQPSTHTCQAGDPVPSKAQDKRMKEAESGSWDSPFRPGGSNE